MRLDKAGFRLVQDYCAVLARPGQEPGLKMNTLSACLGGLLPQLRQQLQQKPCQTVALVECFKAVRWEWWTVFLLFSSFFWKDLHFLTLFETICVFGP